MRISLFSIILSVTPFFVTGCLGDFEPGSTGGSQDQLSQEDPPAGQIPPENEGPLDTPEEPMDTPEEPMDTPEEPMDTPEDPVDMPEDPEEPAPPETPAQPDTRAFEAEDFSVVQNFEVFSDPQASKGKSLRAPSSVPDSTNPGVEASIPFQVQSSNNYTLWIRMLATSQDSDAVYAGFNNSLVRKFNSTLGEYKWIKVSSENLPAGSHAVSLGHGESLARVDLLVVTTEELSRVQLDSFADVSASPPEEPMPPAPPAPPTERSYSLLGSESFSRSDLDNTDKDVNGITLRGWYDLLLKGGTSGEMDGAFGKAENRPANRTGFMYISSLMIGLRLVGDLKLLDESIRLTERWYAKLTPDKSTNNYLHHADPLYDQTLDVTLAAGVWSRVMYAAYVNRGLKSPKGYNYGAIAQKYKTYLTDHFFPRWIKKKSTVKSALDWRASLFRHSQPGILAAQYYIGKMGGGGGYTAAQWSNAAKNSFDQFFSADKVCNAGKGGRETLVFPFNTNENTVNSNGAALIYTTYLRYVISQMMDFFLEEADPRINDLWFKRLSHSLADLVLYPDSKKTLTIGRTIAGDSPSSNERCGVPYDHDYRAPVPYIDRRWQDSGFAFLEGWESTGTLIDFGKTMYLEAPTGFRESYPNYPAARMFTMIYHGRK